MEFLSEQQRSSIMKMADARLRTRLVKAGIDLKM